MNSKRGRLAAIAAVALGGAALLGAGFAFRAPLLERWYLHRLESEDPLAREAAAVKLAGMGSERAVARLIDLCLAESLHARLPKDSIRTIAPFGPQAVSAILERLRRSDEAPRGAFWPLIEALGVRAVSELKGALGHPDPAIRETAAVWLGNIGREAKDAIPDLARMFLDPGETTANRRAAGYALGRIEGPAMTVPRSGLRHPDPAVRRFSIDWLREAGHAGDEAALPRLNGRE